MTMELNYYFFCIDFCVDLQFFMLAKNVMMNKMKATFNSVYLKL